MKLNKFDETVGNINFFALDEGWVLSDSDRHGISIEKDDEQGLFNTDDEAFFHVKALARKGSVLHQQAMRIHLKRWGKP
jgi:hypothetical protein